MRQTPTRFIAFAAAAFFTIAGGETRAATLADACDQYATLAVEQNQLNQSGHCRFTGARWSNDTNGHRAGAERPGRVQR